MQKTSPFRVAAIALPLGNYVFGLCPPVCRKRLPDIDLFFGEFSIRATPDIPFVVLVKLH
jgi:hypothetical protein